MQKGRIVVFINDDIRRNASASPSGIPYLTFSICRIQINGRICFKEGVQMKTLQFDISDELLISLKETPESFLSEFRMAAAAKLYEIGKVSSGRAAELAGIPRVQFLQKMGQYGVSVFDLTKEELAQDLENA